MKKMTWILAIALVAFVAAQAQASFSMWFTDTAGAPISEIDVEPGEAFTVQVWMASSLANAGFSAAVGYDEATSMGTGATPTLGTLGLTDRTLGELAPPYMSVAQNALGGFQPAVGGGSVRPYGLAVATFNFGNLTLTEDLLIVTMNMVNNLPVGQSQDMVIWNNNVGETTTSADAWTTMLNTGAAPFPAAEGALTINSVPEPVSLVLLGLGALGLLRRRSC